MSKVVLSKPTLIMLYGAPGSGKTFFARQLSETISAAHVQDDRIRYELFEDPKYDKQENDIVTHLMEYMAEEFLEAGVSVIFDTNAMRLVQRRALRDIARKAKAEHTLIWLQVDNDSAFYRNSKRDRRRADDKYSSPKDEATFNKYLKHMQNPHHEDYIVISGKHTFHTQQSAVMKRFHDMNLITAEDATANMVKPKLVNLVPSPLAGRVDMKRRNIVIR